MSFFTYVELLKGAERSTRKADVLRRLGDLTRSIPVRCGVSTAMCEHYAVQFTKLRTAASLLVQTTCGWPAMRWPTTARW